MRQARVLVLVGAACALTGCGASSTQQVQAKLQQFAHAVADRDTRALCQQVLAPQLVNRLQAAGLNCEQAMRTFVDSVSDPTLSVSAVRVRGSSAEAAVVAGARNQPSSNEVVELTDTRNGWRLASLASAR